MMRRRGDARPRTALLALDAVAASAVALVWLAVPATPALAYVDPSVMTYTIQALAAVAVALSAVVGVAFRRTRKALMRLFHIEERRELEPDVHRIEPSQKAEADEVARMHAGAGSASGRGGKRGAGPAAERIPWHRRLVASLVVAAFVVFTLMVVAPYELIAGNSSSLVFGLSETWQVFVAPAVLVALALGLVVSALRGRAFDAVLMLLFGFGLATYAQVAFLNGTLPSSDGSVVEWTNYTGVALATLAAWLAIFLAPLAVQALSHRRGAGVAALVSVALVVIQAVGVGSLFVDGSSDTSSTNESGAQVEQALTERGMLTVNKGHNVIVFVLDMFDNTNDLQPLVQSHPEALDEMTGFTWYQNVTATITPTRNAMPAMITGQALRHDETTYAYDQRRWADGAYLPALKAAGYSVGIYSDILPTDVAYISDNVMNAVEPEDEVPDDASLDEEGTLKAIYRCAAFRDLPWVFKPFFWFYTDDVNQAMIRQDESAADEGDPDYGSGTPYATNDALFARKLTNRGISAIDRGETGAFRLYHLMGAHYPYTMDENMERTHGATREQQARGALAIVSEYLRQLKALGLYDDATIIITSDHGYIASMEPLSLTDQADTPILLVKPPESAEAAARPYTVSQDPASNLDVMPTALDAEGLAAQAGDGLSVLEPIDPDRVRTFDFLSKDDQGVEHGLVEYQITGDANDLANWHYTGWVMRYPEGDWQRYDPTTGTWG